MMIKLLCERSDFVTSICGGQIVPYFCSIVVHIRSKINDRLFHVNLAAHAPNMPNLAAHTPNLLLAIEPRCACSNLAQPAPTSLRLLRPPCACSDLAAPAPTSLRFLLPRCAYAEDLAAHAPNRQKIIKAHCPPAIGRFSCHTTQTISLYLLQPPTQ